MKQYKQFLGQKTQAYDLLKFLKDHGIDVSIPIDIEQIIEYLNISYKVNPDFRSIKITGSISLKDNEPFIWVNPMKNTNKERKRFTLAHELGHFMLHMAPLEDFSRFNPINDLNISFNRDDNWDYVEMEANNFAAQLLMPSEYIKKETKNIIRENQNITKEELVEKLSNIVQVSQIAMEYRLAKLGVKL